MDTSEASAFSNTKDAETPSCDRRLSRAAREILRRDVLPILRHYAPPSSKQSWRQSLQVNAQLPPSPTSSSAPPLPVKPMEDHPSELVSILNALLQNNDNSVTNNCALDPNLDLHLPQELQSHLTKKLGGRYKSHLHQCGICRKNFVSKYYLDQHLQHQHHHELQTDNKICLATDICPSIGGMEACHKIAHEMEPYYAPGSGGNSLHDAKAVMSQLSLKLQQSIKPCHEEDMTQLQNNCKNLFTDCFAESYPEMTSDIIQHVCTRYTCHSKIHEYAGRIQYTIHHYKDVWESHHLHGLGYVGGICVVILCVFYLGLLLGFWGDKRRGWLYDWVLKSVRSTGGGAGVGKGGRRLRGGLPDRTSRTKRLYGQRRKEKTM